MLLGFLVILANVVTIYSYDAIAGKDDLNVFYVVTISFTAMGLLYILGLIPFGQVIEKRADGKVATYYRLGKQKFKYRNIGKLIHANLVQASDRYYCLTVRTEDGHTLILEKYPTLDEATERLGELRTRLGDLN